MPSHCLDLMRRLIISSIISVKLLGLTGAMHSVASFKIGFYSLHYLSLRTLLAYFPIFASHWIYPTLSLNWKIKSSYNILWFFRRQSRAFPSRLQESPELLITLRTEFFQLNFHFIQQLNCIITIYSCSKPVSFIAEKRNFTWFAIMGTNSVLYGQH